MKGSFPFMNEKERKKIVESIKYVDKVYISVDKDGTVRETIEKIYKSLIKKQKSYFVFVNGGDRNKKNVPEDKICKELNIEMVYDIGGEKSQSSSWLLREIKKCKIHNEDLKYCEKCLNKFKK